MHYMKDDMNVLVVGNGGREHALAWKIRQSRYVKNLYCTGSNAGLAKIATCSNIPNNDIDEIAKYAKENKIDLVVVGPEGPLVAGLADRLIEDGISVFGHKSAAARIEGSKEYAKCLMNSFDIPTADFGVFTDPEYANKFLKKNWDENPHGYVVKADGLAAGKGVIVCDTLEDAYKAVNNMMVEHKFGKAGDRVIIEERLVGEEASIICMTNSEDYVLFPSSQDHKPAYNNDKGPNTGGMGAYSPAPVVTNELMHEIEKTILEPAIFGMAGDAPLRGFLYAGIMITEDGPRVLEFNARMGDPEAQPLVYRVKSDIVPCLVECTSGDMISFSSTELEIDPRPAVCVVMASKGYPDKPCKKGKLIKGLDDVEKLDDVFVFHAGTAVEDGKVYTSGGRVLGVTALGKNIAEAINRAYDAVDRISCEESGFHYRTDIGRKALRKL